MRRALVERRATRHCDFARLLLTALSGIAGAVLKNIRLAIDRKDDRALLGMRLVKRPDPTPHKFAGPADPFMVVKRALNNVALLDLGMLVHRQSRARLPFQKARQLAFFLVLVQGLDRDAGELRRLPFDVLRLDVNRTADRGLRAARTARLRNDRRRAAHCRAPVSVLRGGAGEGNRTLVVSLGSSLPFDDANTIIVDFIRLPRRLAETGLRQLAS